MDVEECNIAPLAVRALSPRRGRRRGHCRERIDAAFVGLVSGTVAAWGGRYPCFSPISTVVLQRDLPKCTELFPADDARAPTASRSSLTRVPRAHRCDPRRGSVAGVLREVFLSLFFSIFAIFEAALLFSLISIFPGSTFLTDYRLYCYS